MSDWVQTPSHFDDVGADICPTGRCRLVDVIIMKARLCLSLPSQVGPQNLWVVFRHDVMHHFSAHRGVVFGALPGQFFEQVLVFRIVEAHSSTYFRRERLLDFLVPFRALLPRFADGSTHFGRQCLLDFIITLRTLLSRFSNGSSFLKTY